MSRLADRIILHHTPNWWIAEFRGAVGWQMAAMAGAHTLPTGFPAASTSSTSSAAHDCWGRMNQK